MTNLMALRDALRQFAGERDWEKFHSPKNLSMALAAETGELVEKFQWMSEEASCSLTSTLRQEIGEEVADVLLYLLLLADKCDIDLMDAAEQKLQKNRMRYPADKVRGSSRKYSDYE
jgi:dCTP diphosphatase